MNNSEFLRKLTHTMFALTKYLTALILPPFNVLILWLIALIFALLKWRKLSLFMAIGGAGILYIFSIPYTSQKLQDSLAVSAELSLEDYRSAQAIVLLGGGLRDSQELFSQWAITPIPLERMRYAAYLQKNTHLPLLITGSSPSGIAEAKIMAEELSLFFHTPTAWIEGKAKTTKENAQFSRVILNAEKIEKIVLVTNDWHMKRAKFLFEQAGFEVLPANVGAGTTPKAYGLNAMHFIPQAGALSSNARYLKEWIGYWKENLYHKE